MFGQTLKQLRDRLNVTQEQLSARTGVAQATISAIEKRDSRSSRYAVELATGLGVTVEQMKNLPLEQLVGIATRTLAQPLHLTAREPTAALYGSATSVARETLLRLFDELTEPQKATIIEQARALADANRLVLQTFAARDTQGDSGGDHY